MNNPIKSIHEQAVEIAKRFRKAEYDLIDILQQIDDKKVFMHLGYSSLFDYALRALKLSEANTSNFIAVARKSKCIPELKKAIHSGDLSVSKARKITPVITKENSQHWLELAKTLPKPKLEKEVAKVCPKQATPEQAKYVSESRMELKLGISEQLLAKLKRAQNIVSQKTKKHATWEDTLAAALDIYLQKQDPVEKAKRNSKIDDAAASVPGTRYISSAQKHQVHLRDKGQCTHIDNQGQRCEHQRWLAIHHKVPLSQKGSNDTENLQTLCVSHHKQLHLFG